MAKKKTSWDEVAAYLKQNEALEAPVGDAEQAMSENEETKINVKLKEIMDSTETK